MTPVQVSFLDSVIV